MHVNVSFPLTDPHVNISTLLRKLKIIITSVYVCIMTVYPLSENQRKRKSVPFSDSSYSFILLSTLSSLLSHAVAASALTVVGSAKPSL